MQMKKEIEVCDLCGNQAITLNVNILTYRTVRQDNGQHYPVSEVYDNEMLDLCEDCLKKVAVVHNIGVQCKKYELNNNRNKT